VLLWAGLSYIRWAMMCKLTTLCKIDRSAQLEYPTIPRLFSFLPQKVRAGGRKVTSIRHRFLPFPFQSDGRIGARKDGERELRWSLYILLPSLTSLDLGSVSRVEVTLRRRNNLLQLLRLAGSTTSEEMKRCVPAGFGDLDASDLVWLYSAPSLSPSELLPAMALGGTFAYSRRNWVEFCFPPVLMVLFPFRFHHHPVC